MNWIQKMGMVGMVLQTTFLFSQNELQPEHVLWLSRCDSILTLNDQQNLSIYSILLDFQLKLQNWELRKKENNQSDIGPAEWEKNDIRLQAEKKEIRQQKEDQIIALLNEQQKEKYYLTIAPNKPSVLHMGLKHDRANCIVCVKPPSP